VSTVLGHSENTLTRGLCHPSRARLRCLYWGLRATVTLVLVVYLVWRVRAEVGTLQLHLARPVWLALALGCILLAVTLSVWLWYLLIPLASRASFWRLLAHYLLGLFWNNFLPSGMGGDVVRAFAFHSDSGRADIAVSSVLMARLTGLWGTVLLAAGAAVFQAARIGFRASTYFLLIVIGALVVTAGGTVFLLGQPMSVLMRKLPARLGDWHASLRVYRSQPVRLLQALGCALVIQLCAVAVNACTALALNLPITPGQLLLSIPLVNLVIIVPVSLGGFGVRESAYLYFLGLVGVPAADAVLLALVVYALLILVVAVGAGACAFLTPRSSASDSVAQT
jgi:uncharacterized membrane protein YbhN (UPF0104 family)